jgi:hypothetical protein
MDRRDFLKLAGLGVAATALGSTVVSETEGAVVYDSFERSQNLIHYSYGYGGDHNLLLGQATKPDIRVLKSPVWTGRKR